MTQAASVRSSDRNRPAPTAIRSLDELARLTAGELEALYRGAPSPERLDGLDGDCVGRMLAVRGARGGLLRGLGALASWRRFPWEGKSFQSKGERAGTGLNRVHLGGRHRVFPFATRLGPSVLDGRPAVLLDYDLPDNHSVIRAIHDEVREVSPGLYLGPACSKRRGQAPALVLWFALDARGITRAARPS